MAAAPAQRVSFAKMAIILGLLASVGPFAIDMYLPALPTLAASLNSSIASAQMSLTAFFIAFGLAQLVYGPLADQYGRKPPLYAGLAIYVVASVGCAVAPTMEVLIAFRFLQGLGAAVVMVVPRAIIRDLLTGPAATRLMALIMLVISISPMLAPLAGSGIIHVSGWRMIFLFLAVAAVAGLLLTSFALPETLRDDNRVPFNPRSIFRGSSQLLRDRKFMLLTFIGGFGMASFFVFIASASFVYVGQYGLTPTGFSIAFAINALGFFTASQFAGYLGERFGMYRVVGVAVAGFTTVVVALLVLVLSGVDQLPVVVGMLLLANAFMGLVIPTTMVMALDDHGDMAGLASSLGGTLQMMTGGVMIALASPFFDGTVAPMVATIAFCAVMALILSMRSSVSD